MVSLGDILKKFRMFHQEKYGKWLIVCLASLVVNGKSFGGYSGEQREIWMGDFQGGLEIRDSHGHVDFIDTESNKKPMTIPGAHYFTNCEDGPDCSYLYITIPGQYRVRYKPTSHKAIALLAIFTYSPSPGPRATVERLCVSGPYCPEISFDLSLSDSSDINSDVMKIENTKPTMDVSLLGDSDNCGGATE